ncbi:MAG: hypothetical protein L6Q99_08555 [Planctomycetes bacterium]|nr:hypothetical protein [Planctomycetota bacterium]
MSSIAWQVLVPGAAVVALDRFDELDANRDGVADVAILCGLSSNDEDGGALDVSGNLPEVRVLSGADGSVVWTRAWPGAEAPPLALCVGDDVDRDTIAELVIGRPFARGASRVQFLSGASGELVRERGPERGLDHLGDRVEFLSVRNSPRRLALVGGEDGFSVESSNDDAGYALRLEERGEPWSASGAVLVPDSDGDGVMELGSCDMALSRAWSGELATAVRIWSGATGRVLAETSLDAWDGPPPAMCVLWNSTGATDSIAIPIGDRVCIYSFRSLATIGRVERSAAD